MGLLMGVVLFLIVARTVTEWILGRANRAHVIANKDRIPEEFSDFFEPDTYSKSVAYTLAKNRLGQFETFFDAVILVLALFSGVFPWLFDRFQHSAGNSVWAMSAFLFAAGVLLAIPGLPLSWYAQFRLEDRFGFNTTTQKLWWMDRLKGVMLALLLGYPLLALVLKLVDWAGPSWWIWAWACVLGFQVLMIVLAPMLIMPLFNKFTALPEGSLRDRLLALGRRTGFLARSIQVMDGSKRSRHSNAFFTGLGRWRKIVLFDTLIHQLSERELEAVLAHEIGHYKKRHIPKMLLVSALGLFGGFYLVSWFSKQEWFFTPFGFANSNSIVPAFFLFALLSGLVTFWFSPVLHFWSRRYEYQADSYAAATMGEIDSLAGALRKLNEKNLSNLTPHPAYSRFYYSHPTLIERERALKSLRMARSEVAMAT